MKIVSPDESSLSARVLLQSTCLQPWELPLLHILYSCSMVSPGLFTYNFFFFWGVCHRSHLVLSWLLLFTNELFLFSWSFGLPLILCKIPKHVSFQCSSWVFCVLNLEYFFICGVVYPLHCKVHSEWLLWMRSYFIINSVQLITVFYYGYYSYLNDFPHSQGHESHIHNPWKKSCCISYLGLQIIRIFP